MAGCSLARSSLAESLTENPHRKPCVTRVTRVTPLIPETRHRLSQTWN